MHGIWVVAFVLQWIVLALLMILMAGTLRYLSGAQERLELVAPHISNFDIGEEVPPFELFDVHGHVVGIDGIIRRHSNTLILLISPGCTACKTLVMQLNELGSRVGKFSSLGWGIVAVVAGERREVELLLETNDGILSGGTEVLIDSDATVLRAYGVRQVPTGMVVDARGRVESQSFNPHQNWIYKQLKQLPPREPIMAGAKGSGEPAIVAAGFRDEVNRELVQLNSPRRK